MTKIVTRCAERDYYLASTFISLLWLYLKQGSTKTLRLLHLLTCSNGDMETPRFIADILWRIACFTQLLARTRILQQEHELSTSYVLGRRVHLDNCPRVGQISLDDSMAMFLERLDDGPMRWQAGRRTP